MFDSDIERKIIDFIKKSPFGVSSTEIARYLDINRITLSKYLSVIKERTLIDFKQLGMAKLWYIPVKINDADFLRKIIVDIVTSLDNNTAKSSIKNAGILIGKHIESLYKAFYSVPSLSVDQICGAIKDLSDKIGAEFIIEESDEEKIIVANKKSFLGDVSKQPHLTLISAYIFLMIAKDNFSYGKVCVVSSIAEGADEDKFIIYIKDSARAKKTRGISS